ncbi:hypothetical protein KC355_g12722 [Hortaea werneckii]|nr:hypothetical protein KC355_g12722 [Hortaea werneckii]
MGSCVKVRARLGRATWVQGGFEVPPGGIPSPPSSPDAGPLARRPGLKARSRSEDAAHHITEECERLFCETLRTVFLVEKDTGLENSLVMDAPSNGAAPGSTTSMAIPQHTTTKHGVPTPSPSPDTMVLPKKTTGLVKEYVEVFDYVGGLQFRGFVAEKGDERALFVFFENSALGADLKPGLMALLELAGSDQLNCSQLVACVGRQADDEAVHDTTRDLGWVGFELMMLDDWSQDNDCLSDRWIFMGMDV